MALKVEKTTLPGVLKITPHTIFEDFRGSYVESYNIREYKAAGIGVDFLQDDFSISSKDVLRGIHGDFETHKLISCPIGRIYVVIVNNIEGSPAYHSWEAFTLSESNRLQILAPPGHGVAHLVLSDRAMFSYKQSTYYERRHQFTLVWNDPKLNIWWPTKTPATSQRDSGLERHLDLKS